MTYSVCAGTALGSYDATRLRVIRGGLAPREISHLVFGEARVLIRDARTYIVKNVQELALDADQGISQVTRTGTRFSRDYSGQNIDSCSSCIVLVFSRGEKEKCRAGCFFVKRKDSMLHLMADARWSNRTCRAPPYSASRYCRPLPGYWWEREPRKLI